MIYIIDDDEITQGCLARFTGRPEDCLGFSNAIDAMSAIDDQPPSLIFLDILLDGPDGFTFLHELASYSDLSRIPVVLVTSLDLATTNFSDYGVVGVLDKTTITPEEVKRYADEYAA